MALATDYITVKTGIADRVLGALSGLKQALVQRRIYAQTVRELNVLSDNQLNDLGLKRSEIARIAYQAAYAG